VQEIAAYVEISIREILYYNRLIIQNYDRLMQKGRKRDDISSSSYYYENV